MDSEIAKEQLLFEAALHIESEPKRKEFLDRSCSNDLGLRRHIEKLLEAHVKTGRFFSKDLKDFMVQGATSQMEGTLDQVDVDDMIGKRVGRYKILQPLGEGGCGTVYLAEQEEPVRRRVALKVIKFGMDTRSVIARFEAERQALAMMDHPNIAKVLDAGATSGGRPFFVMELVQGVKITTYCDEHHLDASQRLQLFIQVCHAIQHAHQKGVIHRDIKPSNILVTINNDAPMPKVIDFGIAKATGGKLTDNTIFTGCGQFVGTPAYMSPEQAEMSGLDVDTRSDIYSLGVLLYELLTGRTPFDQKELVNSGFDEMRRTLREDEPRRPSVLLTSLRNTDLAATARCRHVEPPKLISSVKGDLDWIVMKALEKERARRYETANGLAMDIQRYLDNEPIVARPPSQFYRLIKLIRRNKVVFASGTIVAFTLIAGLGISTWMYLCEREAVKIQMRLRNEAELARANESQLRQRVEAREKVTQATVLVSHNKMKEADELLAQVPAELFSPSTDATSVFRKLGMWNTTEEHWKQAADRFSILVQVNQVDKSDQTDEATRDLLMAAPLLIEAGDLQTYDRLRRMELKRLAGTTNPVAAEHLVKTTLMLPADAALMKTLKPLGKVVQDSVESTDPKVNDGSFYAAWRTLALGLLEYRRGNFAAADAWLEKCSQYTGQVSSCIALRHAVASSVLFHLGKVQKAQAELESAKEMIEEYFNKGKIEVGDSASGHVQGWLQARVLLREAETTEHMFGSAHALTSTH